MSRRNRCAISSSISFLSSSAIWVHVEMSDATILSSRRRESSAKLVARRSYPEFRITSLPDASPALFDLGSVLSSKQ